MGGIGTAVIASAVIGAASSAYQADQQKKIADDDQKAREAAAVKEQARLDEIQMNTRPEEENTGAIQFGDGDKSVSDGYNQFIASNSNTSLGGTGRSGLGFTV